MRYLTAACPPFSRVLLVESGSRRVLESAIPRVRAVLGPNIGFDLVTCIPGLPSALDPSTTTVWRTQDHSTSEARARILTEMTAAPATVVAIVCSGEPIMTRWKWWLAAWLPSKVLIVNENGDFFWLDSSNLRNLRRLAAVRFGLSGAFPGKAVARAAQFPLVVAYLLLYAAVVHSRQALRRILNARFN